MGGQHCHSPCQVPASPWAAPHMSSAHMGPRAFTTTSVDPGLGTPRRWWAGSFPPGSPTTTAKCWDGIQLGFRRLCWIWWRNCPMWEIMGLIRESGTAWTLRIPRHGLLPIRRKPLLHPAEGGGSASGNLIWETIRGWCHMEVCRRIWIL